MKKWERLLTWSVAIAAVFYASYLSGEIKTERRSESEQTHIPAQPTAYRPSNGLAQIYGVPEFSTLHASLGVFGLTDYEFSIYEKRPDQWGIKYAAWVHNAKPYWLHGYYLIELRDAGGSLLKLFGPRPATFPTVEEPREADGVVWLERHLAEQVDFDQSRVLIQLKKK
jgi:hypothetical protein